MNLVCQSDNWVCRRSSTGIKAYISAVLPRKTQMYIGLLYDIRLVTLYDIVIIKMMMMMMMMMGLILIV